MDKIESSDCNGSNGYINKVFSESLEMKSETGIVQNPISKDHKESLDLTSFQNPIREKQELSRAYKTTGIWRILNHRRSTADCERRPHSMILPGEASASKLSFADKVRGLKNLKSPSVFRGKSGKLVSAKSHNSLKAEINEDSRNSSALLHSQRSILRNKFKRHSYTGYNTEFHCSFDDLDFTNTTGSDYQLPKNIVRQQNCFKTQTCTKKAYSNCSKLFVTVHEEHCVKDSCKVPLGGRRSKGGDVLNYLKRISLIGKGNSSLLEKSFDSMHTLDKTIDSDYCSVDIDCIKDAMPTSKPTGPDVKSGHFRGLFRFFNNMAETARKWRNSSRPFLPAEDECPNTDSAKAQQIQEYLHTEANALKQDDEPFTKPDCSFEECAVISPAEVLSRSPHVMTSWKGWPDSSSTNGFSDGTESQYTSTHTSLATIENHQRSSDREGTSLSEPDLHFDLQSKPEPSGISDKAEEQTNCENRGICNDLIPDCSEGIFKAFSHPPGTSPEDPPFKVVLQRCHSLPLPQNAMSGSVVASLLLDQSASESVRKSATVQSSNGSTRRRKLLRPGSGPLPVNVRRIIQSLWRRTSFTSAHSDLSILHETKLTY